MHKPFYRDFKLGILGGGQLGRMLVQSCIDFNVRTHVLDPDPLAPCSTNCDIFVQGSFQDFETVLDFGRQVDMLTIEIENVNVHALYALSAQGVAVFPQPHVIGLIQDKGLQKQFYATHGFPTSSFQLLETGSDLSSYSGAFPAVLKWRKAGYDGKGVQLFKQQPEQNWYTDRPCLLEQCLPIQHEIAAIVARNQDGACSIYPLVEMVFDPKANLVDYLFSPARISDSIANEINKIALAIADTLGIVGLLAIEFFVDTNNEVFVNEMAPRPHNSGHHSINANVTSQFEQHLRAILGLPLGDTRILSPSVMLNILGQPNHTGLAHFEGIEDILGISGVCLHLYGKVKTAPYRKMGHLTIIDEHIDQALSKVEQIRKRLKVVSAENL
jgi:5-(carboxyamino)imidazole ribonucleotide synthase